VHLLSVVGLSGLSEAPAFFWWWSFSLLLVSFVMLAALTDTRAVDLVPDPLAALTHIRAVDLVPGPQSLLCRWLWPCS
jgi:hypothetical protein